VCVCTQGRTRLQFKRRQSGQVKRQGALVEAPKAPRGAGCGEWVFLRPRGRGLGKWLDPSSEKFLLFDLKMEHFGAVFKLDLTEETRTQLQ